MLRSHIKWRPSVMVLGICWLALSGLALAETQIDTTPEADGGAFPFGEGNTATYGQTFLVSGADTALTNFTFYIDDYMNPGPVDFAAYLLEWGGNRATGPVLWASDKLTTTNNGGAGGYETLTFLPRINLEAGKRYVVAFGASKYFDGTKGTAIWWANVKNPYANGQMVFMNNGPYFSAMTGRAWDGASTYPNMDLAFKMDFGAGFLPSVWKVDGGGSWADSANWEGEVPNATGAGAAFLASLSASQSPAEVRLDGDKTVARLVFDNPHTYKLISGSGGKLVIHNGGGASVSVAKGNHTIAAPLDVADNVVIDVAGGSSLAVVSGMQVGAGKVLSKTGAGVLDATGGVELGAGASLAVHAGRLEVDCFNEAGDLSIHNGGTLALKPAGAVISVEHLNFDGMIAAWRGRLDVSDNDLIVRASAETRDQVWADIVDQVKSARNSQLGLWEGDGITSSAAREHPRHWTGLAPVLNDRGDGTPILTELGGQSVGINDVIVKYTWNGDVTLDGKVDASDYFVVDKGFLDKAYGYRNGDLNFDGRIDASDYFLIDSAFLSQDSVLSSRMAPMGAMVPEPGSAVLLVLMAGGTLMIRRRADAPRRWG